MVNNNDNELEMLRMRKARARPPNIFQRFRAKQVEFGERARTRSLGREEQKLRIQEIREQRQLSQAKVSAARQSISAARAQTSIVRARAARLRPSSSFSVQPRAREQLFGTGTFGVAPATQAKRLRRGAGKKTRAGRKKQRRKVQQLGSGGSGSSNFFGI